MNASTDDAKPDLLVATIHAGDSSYELFLPDAGSDHIQKQVFDSGSPYELDMLVDMCDRLEPDQVVVDVGANVGNHSLYLACVGKCRVVAFEPNAHLCSALRQSASRNGMDGRIVAYELGLGSSESPAHFESAIPSNLGAQRLELGNGDLQVVTLDSIGIAENVHALKIDVEGMELDVLCGAEQLIDANRPLIYVECGNEHSFREILRWGDAHNYVYWMTFNFTPTHLLIPAESASLEDRLQHLSLQPAIQEYRAAARARRSKQAETKATGAAKRAERALKKERAVRESIERALKRAKGELDEFKSRSSELEGEQRVLRRVLEAQVAGTASEIAQLAQSVHSATADSVAHHVEIESLDNALRELEREYESLFSYAAALERRYLEVLDSETWKVMEPVRAVLQKVKRKPPAAAFVPRMQIGGDIVRQATRKQKPPVQATYRKTIPLPEAKAGDLVAKLWGGFSAYAASELQELIKDTTRKAGDRVKAAWHLARWCAASSDWGSCIQYLGAIAYLDKKFYRSPRCRLLVIEANLQSGNIEKARECVEYALNGGVEGNLVCAFSNILLRSPAAEGTEQQRLRAINDLYNSERFAPIELIDDKGSFVFGNFRTGAVAQCGTRGPKISVLVPVYNAGDFVETAMESLLAQSWQDIEIVAVDDCSTDNSWNKLLELADRDDRLRIFRNELNLGAYPTRNRALSLSSGDLITVHDSDDWSHPQMLEVQARTLLSSDDIRGTFSAMARVLPNMEFKLRPERNVLEYVHRSYPSLMMRRDDIEKLGKWDGVAANADDELVQRARSLWGDESLRDVLPSVPLSFFLRHENSLTEQKGTHLKSLAFGIRNEYAKQAEFWRKSLADQPSPDMRIERSDMKTPFPIPNGLAAKNWQKNRHYDLIIISDLSLLGGTRRCNEGYIRAASELGFRVGLFHWPRYDLALSQIASEYRYLSYQPNIDILVPEDDVECDALLIHHPPILKYRIDAVPTIEARRIGILVNQLPMQLTTRPAEFYVPNDVDALCVRLFGKVPEWIPISPLTRRLLLQNCGDQILNEDDWYPPLGEKLEESRPPERPGIASKRQIVLGRHSRDHWTKWPSSRDKLRQAYCADTDIEVRLMGGTRYARKILPEFPSNWRETKFDETSVSEFLDGVDIFLHFVHDEYIEEFGRNIVEAMARGIPTILPTQFKETFGDAALYCANADVESTVRQLWSDPSAYQTMARRGYDFAMRTSDQRNVVDRLARFAGSEPRATADV